MVEREVKLGAPPQFRTPDLEGVGSGLTATKPVLKRLNTTYWDTADLRLARWGVSLRHRDGEGWTVKLPGSVDGAALVRDEITFPGAPSGPPAGALELLRALVRTAELEPVANLRTRRLAISLHDGAGKEHAEVVDDEVSIMDGSHVAARFRQLEVEAKGKSPNGLLDHIVDRLRGAGAAVSEPTPKHVLALGPRALEAPEVAIGQLGDAPTAADAARLAIAGSTARLLRNDPAVRLGGDPESVHQARVATRRLRSDLVTFGPLLEVQWAEATRVELAWIGGLLGALRDSDILLERIRAGLAEAGARGPMAQRLARRVTARRNVARNELLEALSSDRYIALVDGLVRAATVPPVTDVAAEPAEEALPPLVLPAWRKLKRAVHKLGAEPSDEALHRVRIAAKRVRYAAEAVVPVVGKPAARLAEGAAGLQTALGDYNDAVITRAWLTQSAEDTSAATAFIAGTLSERERRLAAEARAAWPKAWKKLDKAKVTAWMQP